MKEKYEDIDLGLEEIVFLSNAEEGNPGIYELTWELGYYNLTIEDKYKIARTLVLKILLSGFVILEKYSDYTLTHKVETISNDKWDDILNNPFYWYPCNEIVIIALTEKGKAYLDKQVPNFKDRLTERLCGKKN
jgi:hypothetical protein